ncbi:MAG: serine/threonine-protein kinase [Planctomycetota bacterium]|jgi:hypothetical protein|nr:serine/threonine-protein kinase [Planctomycetota bacterium]
MAQEHIIEVALEFGLIVQEEVAQAEAYRAKVAAEGRSISTWEAVKALALVDPAAARRIEQRTSTDEVSAPRVAGYEIDGHLGSGGMGEVYLGIGADGDEAAVKLLPQRLIRDSEYLGRFQREVEVMQALDHPHLVRLLAAGENHGRPFIVMELVKGVSLKDHIVQNGALGESEVRVLLRHMADGLVAAWDKGVCHRDVKPANILLGPPNAGTNEPFCAKLCDFGLAKFRDDGRKDPSEQLTGTGIAIGTPHYMSPEQATGDRSADPRHDVYGLGATAYHALLGKTLYSGRSSAVIMYKQATARLDMKPLRERRVSPELIELLEAMLAKPKEVRLSDCREVLERLAALPAVREGRSRTPVVITERDVRTTGRVRGKTKRHQGPGGPLGAAPGGQLNQGKLVVMAIAVVCLVAGVVLTIGGVGGSATVQVTGMGELNQTLATAGADTAPLVIDLEPGTYQGRLVLVAQRPLVLRSQNGDAIIDARSERGAAIDLASGSDVKLEGLRVLADAGPQLMVSAGGRLELLTSRLEGGSALGTVAGILEVKSSIASGFANGLLVHEGASVSLSDSALAGRGVVIEANGAALMLRRSRLVAEGVLAPSLVLITGGTVAAERSAMDAGGRPQGLVARSCGLLELRNVRIENAARALVVEDGRSGMVDGLTIAATSVGIDWNASQPWSWDHVRVDAPSPARGVTGLDTDGSGADPQALSGLPTP